MMIGWSVVWYIMKPLEASCLTSKCRAKQGSRRKTNTQPGGTWGPMVAPWWWWNDRAWHAKPWCSSQLGSAHCWRGSSPLRLPLVGGYRLEKCGSALLSCSVVSHHHCPRTEQWDLPLDAPSPSTDFWARWQIWWDWPRRMSQLDLWTYKFSAPDFIRWW